MPKVLFLYTELAEYIRICFEALAESGVEVHVVAYPVHPEAPFRFDLDNSKVHYHKRETQDDASLSRLVAEVDPAVLLCSGWIDAAYVRICRENRSLRKTVLISDNGWTGGLRSALSVLRARMRYKSVFDQAFVPGRPQVEYARKMGFGEEDIYTGFYTIDPRKSLPLSAANTGGESFPKRFVYAGRYVDFKGIGELWEAYSSLGETEWELHCIGTGPLFASKPTIPGVHHHGFVQPAEMDNFVAKGGVFVLPSHKEPWGMVIHEFAAAGYPLLCSREVGAATAFLTSGKNGHAFPAKNKNALAEAMRKITATGDDDLRTMARKSLEMAGKVNVENWVNTIRNQLIQNHE